MNMSSIDYEPELKIIEKNGMVVNWYHKNQRVFFKISAPTDGWVTLGFNTANGTKGAYLIMGNIINGKVNVIEHYTSSPGNYKPISFYGSKPQVDHINGSEKDGHSEIYFSLPTTSHNIYQKDLSEGQSYHFILAYSREDDFQHHSMMRTSLLHKL
jgi:hypothetical protein